MDGIEDLETLFREAVKRQLSTDVGVIYSSGVDSALVAYAASKTMDIVAYNVGIHGSKDMEYAKRFEKEAPFEVRFIELSIDDIEELIPTIISVSQSTNPLDIGVGIPFYMASKAAASDGKNALLCGQGADELFGGYNRYLECMVNECPKAVEQWMDKDWTNAYGDNLDRDISMCASNDIELRFPFLDKEFSDHVRSMSIDMKIREDADIHCDEIQQRKFARKYAFKKLALHMGLPDYLVNRQKKAAQYGSGTQKALDKIARRNGYTAKAKDAGRPDYLNMYLEEQKPKMPDNTIVTVP